MGIFIKRPLCLFCFCFMGASLLSALLPSTVWLPLLSLSALFSLLLFIFSRQNKKRRYGLIEASISLCCVLLAFIMSFFTIYIPSRKSERLCGEDRPLEFLILNEEYSSKYSTKYSGKALSVDSEEVGLPAYLLLDHESDYNPGDVLYLIGDISITENYNNSNLKISNNHYITIEQSFDKDHIICEEYDNINLDVISAKMRSYVRSVFLKRLDPSSSSLSFALLTGDMSMLSAELVRDFRRAGLLHVIAISGSHFVIIVGALDFVLKKFRVRKSVRIVSFSFISLLILFLSGFSPSASRSVVMLLIGYLLYTLSRDPDAMTSLGVAGAFIMLISPTSVTSVGFWLSFLSTFGLISLASLLTSRLPSPNKKGRSLTDMFVHFSKRIASDLAVTFAANAFICLVLWLVFDEISVIALVTNLIVTPLCNVYLILTLIVFVFGWIPYFGIALAFIMTLLQRLIVQLNSFFSGLSFSVISLNYSFAGVIILLGSVALLVLLTVKLKKKIFTVIPPFAAVLAFCVCLTVHNLTEKGHNVIYTSTERGDVITLTEGSSATIFDASNGSSATLYSAYADASKLCVTEIDAIVLTDYYVRHIPTLDNIMHSEIIRQIYLPAPENIDALRIASDITTSATDAGVDVIIYQKDTANTLDKISFAVSGDRSDLVLSIVGDGSALVYVDTLSDKSERSGLKELLYSGSDILVIGDRAPDTHVGDDLPHRIVLGSKSALPALSGQGKDTKILVAKPKEDDESIQSCVFSLS